MKSCPLCGGPAPDRPGFPGALPCDRCAGAIDVSRALENVGPAPRPRRRLPWAWVAGGAAVLLAGVLVGFLLPSRPAVRAETGAKAEPLLVEARRRIEELSVRPPAAFEQAIRSWSEAEQLLREAELLDPGRVETQLLLGKAQLSRGAEGPAFAAFDRGLALEPANLQALAGKGERVVTTQLLLHLDRLRWPELTTALAARLGETQGRAFDALAPRLRGTEAGLARAYAAVARADWAAAKRALDPIPRDPAQPRLKDELGFTSFVVGYLADPRMPMAASWAGLIRGEEGAAAIAGEREVWLVLVRHLERRAFLSRLPVTRNPRHPVHAGLLRSEAALHESKGDARKAAAVLAEAIAAAPDYLQARLARAAALEKLGDGAEARRETEAALKLASAWGLPPAALREIREAP